MIKSMLTFLNMMAFCALCIFGMVKTGLAEEIIKKAAKSVVREIVQEEIKEILPDVPGLKVPDGNLDKIFR